MNPYNNTSFELTELIRKTVARLLWMNKKLSAEGTTLRQKELLKRVIARNQEHLKELVLSK